MSSIFKPSFILLADYSGPSSGGGAINGGLPDPELEGDYDEIAVSGNGSSSFEGGE